MTAAALFVPGRIEVLGKHTDYAGGRSLLVAVDRGFTVAVEGSTDDRVVIRDTGRDQTVTLSLSGGAEPPADRTQRTAAQRTAAQRTAAQRTAAQRGAAPGEEPGWALYPRTVVRRAARDFPGRLRGCRIELAGTLPSAAGLSTSSALITAVFLALDAVCRFSESEPYRAAIGDPPFGAGTARPGGVRALDPARRASRESLAGYLGAVERGSPYPGLGGAGGGRRGGPEGVGTRGGSEDHVAILCAEPNRLVRYAFEPVHREGAVPMPAGHVFVVAASGVVAEKKGAARARYNRLSDAAARVATIWRDAAGTAGASHAHLGAILGDVEPERVLEVVAARARPDEADALERRVRHFAVETTEIVPAAADALAAGDLARFGELVDRSQETAEAWLGNQVPETVHLARSARELGAVAASAFGAGFGGSVWALVAAADADAFATAWRERYAEAFPARTGRAAFFTTPAAGPARPLRGGR